RSKCKRNGYLNFFQVFLIQWLIFRIKCGKKMEIFWNGLIFGRQVARFYHIILCGYISEKQGVYLLPVDSAEHRGEQEGQNDAPIPDNGAQVIDSIANAY